MKMMVGDKKDVLSDEPTTAVETAAADNNSSSCFMCQIHEALRRDDPEAMPEPIATAAQAEGSMTTLLCCGASTFVMWRYRRTHVVRRFVTWLLVTYFLCILAFVFFVATVCLL